MKQPRRLTQEEFMTAEYHEMYFGDWKKPVMEDMRRALAEWDAYQESIKKAGIQ